MSDQVVIVLLVLSLVFLVSMGVLLYLTMIEVQVLSIKLKALNQEVNTYGDVQTLKKMVEEDVRRWSTPTPHCTCCDGPPLGSTFV